MIQMALVEPADPREVMGGFAAWIKSHICDFGHERPPRYPCAPDVYRSGYKICVVNVQVLRWEDDDTCDVETIYEAYWWLKYDGTWQKREGPPCWDSMSTMGYWARWDAGAVVTSVYFGDNWPTWHDRARGCR